MRAVFLEKRVFPGFKIREAILWLGAQCLYNLGILAIYFFGNAEGLGTGFRFTQMLATQGLMALVQNLVLLPLWWLHFKKFKAAPIRMRFVLHLITALIYIYFFAAVWMRVVMNENQQYSKIVLLSHLYSFLVQYVSIFAVLHGYNYWRSYQDQKAREQQLKDLAYQSEIRALKAQIEPHFLFNTLNSISASIPPSMEQTRIMIAQLADTFRHALEVSGEATILLQKELTFLQNWLALEQYRFRSKLEVVYLIDEECLTLPIAPMLLQPLVENALIHGIAPLQRKGMIWIECRQKNEALCLSVRDNGAGYNGCLREIPTKGVGVNNVTQQLRFMYKEPLHIAHGDPGLSFSFAIPLTKIFLYEKTNLDYR